MTGGLLLLFRMFLRQPIYSKYQNGRDRTMVGVKTLIKLQNEQKSAICGGLSSGIFKIMYK